MQIEYKELFGMVNEHHRKVNKEREKRIHDLNKMEERKIKVKKDKLFLFSSFLVFLGIITFLYNFGKDDSQQEVIEISMPENMNICCIDFSKEKENAVDRQIEYIAKCVLAEAGNQDEYGKRLVIDVILNRKENTAFPDTYEEVINQPNQFEVVKNGSINDQVPNEYIYNLISQELEKRTDSDVLYFKTIDYHDFAEPVIHHQDHYFSK